MFKIINKLKKLEIMKLTKEIKQAIRALINEDNNYRYPEKQPLDSRQSKKCMELKLINERGEFFHSLPEDIANFIDKLM